MGNEIATHVQEAQRLPYRINPRRITPRHILIKQTKINSMKNIKAARGKQQITYKGIPIKISDDFLAGTLQSKRQWQGIFKVMKQKILQPRLLNPGKLSFRFDGAIKSFTDKKKLREFSTTKPALRQIIKELLSVGNTREEEEKTYKNKPQTIKKMVIGIYIFIITLNVNGLNAPTKRYRLAEGIQRQDVYICYLQETHFRPRDTYRLIVKGWKKILHANGNQKKAGVEYSYQIN